MSAAVITPFPESTTDRITQKGWLTIFCLVVVDVMAVLLGTMLGLSIFQAWNQPWKHIIGDFVPVMLMPAVFVTVGLYSIVGLSPAQELRTVLVGSAPGYVLVIVLMCMRETVCLSMCGSIAFAWVITIFLVVVFRSTCRELCFKLSWWGTPTIILGSGTHARAVFRSLESNSTALLKVVAVFANDRFDWPELADKNIHLDLPQSVAAFAERSGVRHAVVAAPSASGAEIEGMMAYLAPKFKHLLLIPNFAGISSVWVEPRDVSGMLGLHVKQNLTRAGSRFTKRAFDMVITGIAGIIFLPAFAVLSLAVWVSSPGPIFYGQVRVGRAGKMFKAWKFRTMHLNADSILSQYLAQDQALRAEWERDQKLKKDPRVTRIGAFLRKMSVDELPQLWNIFAGDMSLVGPRPIVLSEISRYGNHFDAYKRVRPGLTGLWQISGRNNTTYQERVSFDEYYVRNWSIWLDLYILLRTLRTVLLGEGAY
ncbi:MAG: undecaprenyl-phosphate galactose phosphotransferase WbaP [Acidobacteriaceae bacterium]|nr:undecaprenyl-phosphate galactose phosphotransferase WbaP [Acidobacteriaceae bacterium]